MMASLACVEDKMKTSGLVNGATTTTTASQSTLLEEMKLLKDQSGFIFFLSQEFDCKFSFFEKFHSNFFFVGLPFVTKGPTFFLLICLNSNSFIIYAIVILKLGFEHVQEPESR